MNESKNLNIQGDFRMPKNNIKIIKYKKIYKKNKIISFQNSNEIRKMAKTRYKM